MNAVWILFGTQYLGVSHLQTVVLLSMPFYLVGAALQVPTGIWADHHGRVRAHVVGGLCSAFGFVPFLITREFVILLITIPFLGLGHALRSSSVEALASNACDRDKSFDFHKVTSHGRVLYFAAHSTGAIVGAALYSTHALWLIGISIAAMLASSGVALLLRSEPTTQPFGDVSHFRQLLRILRETNLWMVLAGVGGLFLAIDTTYFAYQPVFSKAGLSTTSIGWIYAVLGVVSISGAFAYRHLGARIPARQTVSILGAAVALTGAGMLATNVPFLLIIFSCPLFFATAMVIPFANTHVVARTPQHLRAAALSTVTLAWNVATLIAWTSAAAMVDNVSLKAPLLAGAIIAVTVAIGVWLNKARKPLAL